MTRGFLFMESCIPDNAGSLDTGAGSYYLLNHASVSFDLKILLAGFAI